MTTYLICDKRKGKKIAVEVCEKKCKEKCKKFEKQKEVANG